MNLTELPLGDVEREINAVVEIPKGSKNKYEYQPEWNAFVLDRVLPGPLQFPTAYGFIPQTVGPDGDEVDVLVVQDQPVAVGIVVRARPIGMFRMRWEGSDKEDDKILAVSANDPMYSDCTSMKLLPKHYLAEIDYFFRSYLALEDPGISTDWADAEAARRAIVQGHEAYCARVGARD